MPHTKGPWRVEIHNEHTSIESKYFTIASNVSNDDAELIAAAPELLRALKNIMSSIPIVGTSIALAYDIQNAQRVINKAEGRKARDL